MDEPKVAKAAAEAEFDRFIETMELDISPEGMDEEDRKGFQQSKRRFLAAVCNGSLVVNDKGEPVFTPRVSEPLTPITFYEPTGATIKAIDQGPKNHDVDKMIHVMAAMTKQDGKRFGKMLGRDLKVCQAIVALYVGG